MPPYFDLLQKYFPDLTPTQLDRFRQLWDLYRYWNTRINVISRKDIDELYLRHVLHSLSVAKLFHFKIGSRILDVGTGGGFPGVPLSIYFEKATFTLVDSIGKKIKVVTQVIDALKLENAIALQTRAEDVKDQFDVIVSRAVTNLPTFFSWVSGKVKSGDDSGVGNGIIYIKGGDLDKELNAVPWTSAIFDISAYFREDFFRTKKLVQIVRPQ